MDILVHDLTYTEKDRQRFESYLHKTPTCWRWLGAKNKDGYGRFWLKPKLIYAHRFAYELFVGATGTQLVLHRCDQPNCCNPDHLYLGSVKDNAQDCIRSGRTVRPSKFSSQDILDIRALSASGLSQRQVAEYFDTSHNHIGRLLKRGI